MTAKEKADELFSKFRHLCTDHTPTLGVGAARQCALLAVDEILQAIGYCENPESNYNVDCYWAEVKREIEKVARLEKRPYL